MKLYGFEINEGQLMSAIEEAEAESLRNNLFEYRVILDGETGKLYQISRPCGDNSTSERIWNGTDKPLYTANNQFFDIFRDWMVSGLTEDEINEFCRDVVGDQVYAQYEQQKADDDDEDPIWELIWHDGHYCDDLRDAVADRFMVYMMDNFDAWAILEQIEQEANRQW